MPKKKPKKTRRNRPRPKTDVPKQVANMAAASLVTGIPIEILKRYRKEGCAAFQTNSSVRIAELLKFHKEQPKTEEKKPESKGMVKHDLVPGLNEAWQRVKQAEADCAAIYFDALNSKDAQPWEKKQAYEQWQTSLATLRMYNKGLDDKDRSDDKMRPQSEMETFARNLIVWHKIALSDALRKISPNLEALKGDAWTRNQIAAIIDPVIRESTALALDYGRQAGKLPPWMIESTMLGLKEAKDV